MQRNMSGNSHRLNGFVTINEAAVCLRKSVSTIRGWRAGKLSPEVTGLFIKLAGTVYFDLEAFYRLGLEPPHQTR